MRLCYHFHHVMSPQSRASNEVFQGESVELGKARLRLGCVAIALLKPLFLPLFYINAPESFPLVLALYCCLVLICAVTYYLSYRVQRPYTLVIFMLVSTYWLVVLSLFATGMSNSIFFPLLLMCITGIGLIASWSLIHSLIVFGLIVGFYFGGVLLFDPAVDRQRITIQAMAIGDATLVGTFGIYLLEQVRRKEFRKRIVAYKDRELIGRMLHDSLGADLHNIGLLCELTQRHALNNREVNENISRIAETSRKGLEDIRDFLSMEDRDNILLNDLSNRMRDYGNRVFAGNGTAFTFHVALSAPERSVSHFYACNLYLLYKEAVTNVARHAHAKTLAVSMASDGKNLSLTLRDDGSGFGQKTPSTGGRGLNNIRARAEELGGALEILTQQGHGTELRLVIPVSDD